MVAQKKEYEKLPGRYWALIYSSTLWLGTDHVLAVYNKFFSEEYKRFYFKDIQRITVRKTNNGKIWNGIWAGMALIFALFLIGGWSPFPAIMAGFFLILCLINWRCGPTCLVHFQTAVQVEKIPALHRWKTALRTLNSIRPLIEKIQGALPDEIPEQAMTMRQQNEQAAIARPKNQNPIKHEKGLTHLLLFFLLLVNALITLIDYHFNFMAITIAEGVIGVGIMVLVIIAIVKQYQSDLTKDIKSLTWAVLVYQSLSFVWGYFFFLFAIIKSGKSHQTQWDYLQIITNMSPADSMMLKIVFIIDISVTLLIGVSGIILLYKRRG